MSAVKMPQLAQKFPRNLMINPVKDEANFCIFQPLAQTSYDDQAARAYPSDKSLSVLMKN